MSRIVRACLVPVVLLSAVGLLPAQTGVKGAPAPETDPPARQVSRPATRQELDRLEALTLYGLGVMQEHANCLVEAAQTFEQAARLDPEGAASFRALVPIYLALDRSDDALGAARRVLELDPDDFETGYQHARQLRSMGRLKEALAVLRRTAACPGLKDRLDVKAQVFYDLGLLYDAAGAWNEAEQSLREVTAILDNPDALLEQGPYNKEEITAQAAETYERLGRVCLKAGRPQQAVVAFQAARKKDPLREGRLAFNLAEVHISQGNLRDALASLDEYLRTQPQGMEGYEMKVTVLEKMGRRGDVVPALASAVEHDPHNVSLKLLLARECRKAGQTGQARNVYLGLLRESPTPEVYRALFALERTDPAGGEAILKRLDEALSGAIESDDRPGDANQASRARAMLVVLREDPELVKRMLPAAEQRLLGAGRGRTANLQPSTRVLLATLAARTNQLEAAEALYRSCLAQAGGPRGLEQEAYQGLLRVLSLGHKHEAIVALCNQGLAQAQVTNRVLFHLQLARSQMALNRVREALAAADAAVNEAGEREHLLCCLTRAQLLGEAGKHEQGVAECQALLKKYNQKGDVRDIRSQLSAIYSAAHDYAHAEEQLQNILREDSNDATANNDLGYLWADQNKNLEEAEQLVRKALALDRQQRTTGTAVSADSDQDNAAYVDSLGWVLFRRGQWSAARAALERAVTLAGGKEDPVVWDHLGDVYFRLGERPRAGAAWKRAIALYEAGARRPDDHYREIRQKIRFVEP
jgi:tetratricopeptide (TPR) repeat protein